MSFKDATTKYEVTDYIDFRSYLKDIYNFSKRHRKPYSYEIFSEELGLGRNNVVYLVVRSKRSLSEKNAKKIATSLGLVKEKKVFFGTL